MGEDNEIMDTPEALRLARSKELDLVVITDNAKPPVAKILDFNKFLYEQSKKSAQIKAKAKVSKLKEFRLGPTTDDGAIDQRVSRAREFLKEGNRVKFTVKLRGRQRAHPELGVAKIQKCLDDLSDIAKPEDKIKMQGGTISAILVKA